MSLIESHVQVLKTNTVLRARDLGRMAYAPALALQREVQQAVIAARDSAEPFMEILLVEHDPPVITVSRRPGSRNHLIATEAQLKAAGVEVAETDRGGDITYHGPGQLVAYPILDLNVLNLRMVSYLRLLEQVVIDTLDEFGIKGHRDPFATGVWVTPHDAHGLESIGVADRKQLSAAKICALGVRVSRWVTMHGLALNVTTNLDHFNLIVPCGLAGRSVTSMQRELGANCPGMENVKRAVITQFGKVIARDVV
jgi:lipoyl(octanoyl) transferase